MNNQESAIEYFTQILTLTNQMKTYALQAQTNRRNTYDGRKNKKGKGKWKNNKWKNFGEGLSNLSNQNHNEENNKSERNNKGGKKKFNKKRFGAITIRRGLFPFKCWSKKVQGKEDEVQLAHDEDFDSDDVLLMVTTKSKDDNFDLWYLDTRTFKIEFQIMEHQCLATTISDASWVWHHSKSMVISLPKIEKSKQLYVECYETKLPRNSFKLEIPIRSKEKLEVICLDVCDHFELKSLGGNDYFVSFINEFTKKKYGFIL
ncbi:hypothetical protein CR513_25198, partial [Mucuna pruriens]